MDKNIYEKQNLYEWACKYTDVESKKYFTDMDRNLKSYYEKPGNEYLQEYGFENIGELKAMLKELWEDDPLFHEMQSTILAAAFKNMPASDKAPEERNPREELPTFIYSF